MDSTAAWSLALGVAHAHGAGRRDGGVLPRRAAFPVRGRTCGSFLLMDNQTVLVLLADPGGPADLPSCAIAARNQHRGGQFGRRRSSGWPPTPPSSSAGRARRRIAARRLRHVSQGAVGAFAIGGPGWRAVSRPWWSSPVPLTNGRGVFSQSLGEFALGAILYFAKDLRRMNRNQEAGRWEPFDIVEISGQTVGILGYGDIGRAVASRVRPMGMRVLAVKRHGASLYNVDPLVHQIFPPDKRTEMLAQSDYIVAAAPLTPETRGMIGEAEFQAMKPTAVVINIGRGPVIDEAAMVRALAAKPHQRRRAGRLRYRTPPARPSILQHGKPPALAALRRPHARLDPAGNALLPNPVRALFARKAARERSE